jgi:glycosyltransferase involved in cell wall biosynthesis
VPEALVYWALRRFHAAGRMTMVSTRSLVADLRSRGFRKIGMWTRGVDTDFFAPVDVPILDLPRPIFMNVGRVAVEKNLGAFLSLDLPGSKVVIGDGPQLPELRHRFPDVHFLGAMEGERLVRHLASADVFVFPSRTDTFGIVQLEALACGVPVAAFPVTGPLDVLGGTDVGALDEDLGAACRAALGLSRQACREFALSRSWNRSARQFLRNVGHALIRPVPRLAA